MPPDAQCVSFASHFASKAALWEAAVDHLFTMLLAEVGSISPAVEFDDPQELAAEFAERIRRFVRFAAAHPELNQILVHEATDDTARLRWLVDRHVRPLYLSITTYWDRLRDAGIAAPVATESVHYVLVGAASLPFVNAPEMRLLTGTEPTEPSWVEAHADGIVATLLPGLATASTAHGTGTGIDVIAR